MNTTNAPNKETIELLSPAIIAVNQLRVSKRGEVADSFDMITSWLVEAITGLANGQRIDAQPAVYTNGVIFNVVAPGGGNARNVNLDVFLEISVSALLEAYEYWLVNGWSRRAKSTYTPRERCMCMLGFRDRYSGYSITVDNPTRRFERHVIVLYETDIAPWLMGDLPLTCVGVAHLGNEQLAADSMMILLGPELGRNAVVECHGHALFNSHYNSFGPLDFRGTNDQ